MKKNYMLLLLGDITETPKILKKMNAILADLRKEYLLVSEVNVDALNKTQTLLNFLYQEVLQDIKKQMVEKKQQEKLEKQKMWELSFQQHKFAFFDEVYDKAIEWNDSRKVNNNIKKTIELIDHLENLSVIFARFYKTHDSSKDLSPVIEKMIEEVRKFLISLNAFQKSMQKQGFFFSREEITPATASKMLSKDIQQLDDLYTKYLDIDEYLNIDVLSIAQDKIKNALVLLNQNSQRQASTRKTAILDTLMNWKASFDIGRDMKVIKEIIKDCIDTRNIYYNSADPKKVKASKELQKAITLLMDFSEDLKNIQKGL